MVLACVLLPRADVDLGRRLFAVSPILECDGEIAFLEDRGLERLHGGPAGLFAAIRRALAPELPTGLALASNRFTAEVAARYMPRPVTVHPGEEALFLSRLPLSALPMSVGLARRLEPLGLATLGDFASLPSAAVERRYGVEGVALHRLARGDGERGLLPERERRELVVLCELEASADRLDRILPSLEEMVTRLCGWMGDEGRGAMSLELSLRLDPSFDAAAAIDNVAADGAGAPPAALYTLSLPAPENRAALLIELLRLKLEEQQPGGPVVALSVAALQTAPMGVHQNSLFGDVARDAARRAAALARLSALLGDGAVSRPRLLRAHRLEQRWTQDAAPPHRSPAAAAPAGRVSAGSGPAGVSCARLPADDAPGPTLRLLPTPEELVAVHVGGRLIGFRRGRQELPIARMAGPRRLIGGWWDEPWQRDEYELLTPEGGLYRVCRDDRRRRWLLLAEAD